MRTFEEYIRESVDFRLGGKDNKGVQQFNYFPKDKVELKELMEKLRQERGEDADFNDIDTSNVTNMYEIFYNNKSFKGDISLWDTSSVENMSAMFCYAERFNRDITSWDTSKVTNMRYMFYYASSFNQGISSWDTSNVTDMDWMFYRAISFKQDISQWNIGKVISNCKMFEFCPIKEEFKPKFKK